MTETLTTSIDSDEIRAARAQLLRIAEPEDLYIALSIELFGAPATAALVSGERKLSSDMLDAVAQHLEPQKYREAIEQRVERWKNRKHDVSLDKELMVAQRIDGWFCTPEDTDWPSGLTDLGPKAPYGIWGRGDRDKLQDLTLENSIAVVGSRDTSTYGNSATSHIVGGVSSAGITVISGGAFGIDAVAHRTALAASTGPLPTLALMACGIDRLYPKHNENLLLEIVRTGLILSEVPLGYSPTRWRFLQRNRLIAALARATLVVEARWRSGALNTAHHALEIGRDLYAVPGPIFNPTSEGCHRLITDGHASLCTSAETLIQDAQRLPLSLEPNSESAVVELTEVQTRVWDALPLRNYGGIDTMSSLVGIGPRTMMQALSQLKTLGMVETNGVGWRKKTG